MAKVGLCRSRVQVPQKSLSAGPWLRSELVSHVQARKGS